MKPEEYSERIQEVGNWQVRLTCYKLGDVYHCKADSVSPGAWLARATAPSRQAAEHQALNRAQELLSRINRRAV